MKKMVIFAIFSFILNVAHIYAGVGCSKCSEETQEETESILSNKFPLRCNEFNRDKIYKFNDIELKTIFDPEALSDNVYSLQGAVITYKGIEYHVVKCSDFTVNQMYKLNSESVYYKYQILVRNGSKNSYFILSQHEVNNKLERVVEFSKKSKIISSF